MDLKKRLRRYLPKLNKRKTPLFNGLSPGRDTLMQKNQELCIHKTRLGPPHQQLGVLRSNQRTFQAFGGLRSTSCIAKGMLKPTAPAKRAMNGTGKKGIRCDICVRVGGASAG